MVQGIRSRQHLVRMTALGVIGLVCVKVFAVDMSGLTGLWRVLSFLGLGMALIGLARWVPALRAAGQAGTGRVTVGSVAAVPVMPRARTTTPVIASSAPAGGGRPALDETVIARSASDVAISWSLGAIADAAIPLSCGTRLPRR